MVLFGRAGALVSFGLWWMLCRYRRSIGDAAGVRIPCTRHCGGVDGPFLAGVIASICVALVGLAATAASLGRLSRPS